MGGGRGNSYGLMNTEKRENGQKESLKGSEKQRRRAWVLQRVKMKIEFKKEIMLAHEEKAEAFSTSLVHSNLV